MHADTFGAASIIASFTSPVTIAMMYNTISTPPMATIIPMMPNGTGRLDAVVDIDVFNGDTVVFRFGPETAPIIITMVPTPMMANGKTLNRLNAGPPTCVAWQMYFVVDGVGWLVITTGGGVGTGVITIFGTSTGCGIAANV